VLGGQAVDEFTIAPTDRVFRRVTLPASGMGGAEMAELQVVVDKTFVPSTVSAGTNKDPRELGVRVFHAFVDPR
jgi:hypothetical protein